uniref:Uncharacterized protein n=1 Tax=Rhizophora mucronata TaxID=61149 RepID=A0A2P2PNL3_RHIMU
MRLSIPYSIYLKKCPNAMYKSMDDIIWVHTCSFGVLWI